jgi:hypothetical protein
VVEKRLAAEDGGGGKARWWCWWQILHASGHVEARPYNRPRVKRSAVGDSD